MIPFDHHALIGHVMDFPEPGKARIRRDVAVEIRDGRVVALRSPEEIPPSFPALDVRPAWILPGLVDLHTHPVQHRVRGRAGLPLLPWLERYVFPEERRFRNLDYAERVFREAFGEALRHGTTLMAGLLSAHPEVLDIAFQVAREVGIRTILGWVWMEEPEEFARPLEDLLAIARAQITFWHGREDFTFVALAPRFALSCSARCMEAIGKLHEVHGVYVHTHVSENPDEVREVLRRFGGRGYLDVYDRAGLLGPRTFLAHGVYLWAREFHRIRERGSVVVHCPTANAFLHSGVFPRDAARSHGIRLALGSDVGAGWTYNMFTVIRQAYLVHREPLSWLFYDATRGGALAAGMERLGLVEEGYWADLAVLRPAEERDTEEMLSRWVFSEGSPVRGVMVNGRWLFYEETV